MIAGKQTLKLFWLVKYGCENGICVSAMRNCDRVRGQYLDYAVTPTGVGFVNLVVLNPAFAHKKCFQIKAEALVQEMSLLCGIHLVCGCFRKAGAKGWQEWQVWLNWRQLRVSRCGGLDLKILPEWGVTRTVFSQISLEFSPPTCQFNGGFGAAFVKE